MLDLGRGRWSDVHASESSAEMPRCECGAILSRFHPNPFLHGARCAPCDRRIEEGRARAPAPPAFAPRPPAPERPTTEGCVPLPGVVPGRERSYAEMIAMPTSLEEASRCAECGKPMPIARHGWLCGTCLPGEGVDRQRDRCEDTSKPEITQARIPPRAHGAPKAPIKRGPMRPETHRRKFDWEDAARRYEAGATYRELTEICGVTKHSVVNAVQFVLGYERARELAATRKGGGRCGRPRAFDHESAADLYLDLRNFAEVARRLGVQEASMRYAIKRELARRAGR